MAEFTIAVLAVAIERVLVVAAALTSIVLGWNLFVRAITISQSGTISAGDWKFEFKSVGPGIFFSLFGSVILVYVLFRPAQYTVSMPSGPGGPVSISALGVGSPSDFASRSQIRSINTIVQLDTQFAAQPQGNAALLQVQRTELTSATMALKQLRRQILVSKFGAPPIDEWEKNQDAYVHAKHTLPADLQQRMDKIAPWMTENMTDERAGK
jgi:hypothetical protein